MSFNTKNSDLSESGDIETFARLFQFLQMANAATIRSDSEPLLLQKICELALESGCCLTAWIGMFDNAAHFKIVAAAGGEACGLDVSKITASEQSFAEESLIGKCLLLKTIVYSDSIAADPTFVHWLSHPDKNKETGVIGFPIEYKGKILGVLGLHTYHAIKPNTQEEAWLQAFVESFGFRIKHLRMRAQRDELQATMFTLAINRTKEDEANFFHLLAQHIEKILHAKGVFIIRFLPNRPNIAKSTMVHINGERMEDFEGIIQETASEDFFSWNTADSLENKLGIFVPKGFPDFPSELKKGMGCRLRNSSGEPVGILCTLFEDTAEPDHFLHSLFKIFSVYTAIELQHRNAEERIQQQESMLDQARDAILVRTLDGQITYWNQSAEQMYAWNKEEALGRPVTDLIYKEQEIFNIATKEVLEKGTWAGEHIHYKKTGERIIVDARWNLLRDENGRATAIFTISSDVTAQKKMEEQLLRSQRLESIGTLASGIAHDLNNVLAPIMMSIDLLKDSAKNTEDLEILNTIESSANHGMKMVKQVLTFARGVHGKTVEVQIAYLIREIQTIIRDTFPKNIQLHVHVDSDLFSVTGDPTNLQQVLLNLCVNARDAMSDGGMLTITAKNTYSHEIEGDLPEASYVAIGIEDTGTGISQKNLSKIFDPFFTTKEVGKGTGLGLATSLAIIQSHKGFIRPYSEVNKGTAFHIYLPANGHAKTISAVRQNTSSAFSRGHGETVLVIDDEPAIREVLKRLLEIAGYKVLITSDGVEGVALYKEKQSEIDIVITDIMMPNMGGQEVIRILLKENPAVRIIASSGITANEEIIKTEFPAVREFLPKPYEAKVLLSVLERVLKQKVQHRNL